MTHIYHPSSWEVGAGDQDEFRVTLGSLASLMPAWATWHPVLEKI